MSSFRSSWSKVIRWIGRKTQRTLDNFYYFREVLLNWVAFLSLRIYAKEVSFQDVKSGKYSEEVHEDRNLEDAKDLDALLAVAKDCYKAAGDRRTTVTDKCKTLLTLSTFILAITGLFLPKPFEMNGFWTRILVFAAGFLILDAVLLLLVYFGIGTESRISLEQSIVPLNEDDLKKALINEYLSCEVDSENRTHYLVDVYKTARFFALTGFLLLLVLVSRSFLSHPTQSNAKQLIEEIRKDPQLADLLRGLPGKDGAKGNKGDAGVRGPKGDSGPIGARGEPGPIGPKGESGAVGPKGEKGDRGERGEKGGPATATPK